MTNKHPTNPEIHKFTMLDPATRSKWKLAGDAELSNAMADLADETIDVTIPERTTGTVSRVSTDAGLLTVAGQAITAGAEAGTIAAPKTASINVDNGVSSLTDADLTAATGAAAALYADGTFATAQSPVNLKVGANNLYVKVTAEDGTTVLYYDVTVTRASGGGGGGCNAGVGYGALVFLSALFAMRKIKK
jgi:hypothetical protein